VLCRREQVTITPRVRQALKKGPSDPPCAGPTLPQGETMILLELLMLPSNLVCDHLGLTDEHERGMMRMFVNMCLFSALCVIAFLLLWVWFA
jgi:hypothetical protein